MAKPSRMKWRFFEDFYPEVQTDHEKYDLSEDQVWDKQADLAAAEIKAGMGIICPLEEIAWKVAHKADPKGNLLEIAKSIKPDHDGNGEVFMVFRVLESDMVWKNYK